MKTFKLLFIVPALVFATVVSFAQDDVYYKPNNKQKKEKEEKDFNPKKRKINSGYVFIDGKYVEPPYTIKRKKCGIYINNIKITKCHLISDKRSTIKIRKDPGSPKNIDKMDNINVVFRDTILEYNINYVLANYYYYYGKYSDDKAMRLMKEFFQGLPNIKSVEGEETLHVTAWNGDIKMLSVRPPVPTYNKLQKKRHLRYNHNLQVDMFKERFIKGGVSFIFPDDKTLDGYAQISFGATIAMDRLKKIYEILVVDTITNETKVKQLKENVFLGNSIDKYLDVFVENMDTLVLKEILENNYTLTYTEGDDNFDKIGFISDTCMRLKDPESKIAFSPKSNFVNIGCPDPWGSVFLGLNPSFETVSQKFYELVEHQGYNDICYNIDLTNNDVQTGSLTYENFKNFCAGGVNLWMSHGAKSTTNMEGYIQVAYFNSTENDIDLVLQDWFGGNDMSGFGVIEAINPNENNWGGDTPPFILVAYPEVASNLWKPKVNTYNSITMISSCYSYQNGFVQACGTNGATFGYNNVVMGVAAHSNNKALLKRLNGTINTSGNYFRNTGSAYNNYSFSNLKMYPQNTNITLCPATKSFYPENNSIVSSDVNAGEFVIDTWCDASVLARQALSLEITNGDLTHSPIDDIYWDNPIGGKSNKIIYRWTGTHGTVRVKVNTNKIRAYGGGGQKLDFDRKTPNGETNAYYVFYVGNANQNPNVVDFVASQYEALAYTPIHFTNQSSVYNSNGYFWDFGDGTTSTQENPTHTYTDQGVYDVTLKVSTNIDDFYETKNGLITILSECSGTLYSYFDVINDKKVNFQVSYTGAYEPLVYEYRFTIYFGDGTHQSKQGIFNIENFEKEYSNFGDYYPIILVETLNQFGESICLKEYEMGLVQLNNPFPCSDFNVDFNISPDVAYLNSSLPNPIVTVNFNNTTSGGNNYTWIWQFDADLENGYEPQGGVAVSQYIQSFGDSGNTSKNYTKTGIYPVTLTVFDENGCYGTKTKNVFIADKLRCINNLRIQSYSAVSDIATNRIIVPWQHNNQECLISLKSEYEFCSQCQSCDNCGGSWQAYKWYVNNDLIKEEIVDYKLISEGHIYDTDINIPTFLPSFKPYKNIISNVISGRDNTVSVSCQDSTSIEIIAINCEGVMNSGNFLFTYLSHNLPLFPDFTNEGFMIENTDKLEFFSGKFVIDNNVNQIIQNNNVELLACNGIVLTDGFNTGNKRFIASGGVNGGIIEGCNPMPQNYFLLDSSNINNSSKEIKPLLKIVPNPISLNFTIYVYHPSDDILIIELLDSSGRTLEKVVENNKKSGVYEFNINDFYFQPGLYFCKYSNSNSTITEKFVKSQ